MKRSSIFWRLTITEIVHIIIVLGIGGLVGYLMLSPGATIYDVQMMEVTIWVVIGLLFILKICMFWAHADDICKSWEEKSKRKDEED